MAACCSGLCGGEEGRSTCPNMHSPINSSLKIAVEMTSSPLYNGVIPPKPQFFHWQDRWLHAVHPLVPSTWVSLLTPEWVGGKWTCWSPFIPLMWPGVACSYTGFCHSVIIFRRIPVDQHVLICMYVVLAFQYCLGELSCIALSNCRLVVKPGKGALLGPASSAWYPL
jgi:hypothetical protein